MQAGLQCRSFRCWVGFLVFQVRQQPEWPLVHLKFSRTLVNGSIDWHWQIFDDLTSGSILQHLLYRCILCVTPAWVLQAGLECCSFQVQCWVGLLEFSSTSPGTLKNFKNFSELKIITDRFLVTWLPEASSSTSSALPFCGSWNVQDYQPVSNKWRSWHST